MFIDPIISDENISKEVNAIESEFNMHFNESEFMWDVCNQYLTDRHPATNFDCGNKHTLFNNIEDKVFLSDIIHLFRYY
jgi:secreted Zn-dependent insulinase-like peptidase